jgi:Fic family protein
MALPVFIAADHDPLERRVVELIYELRRQLQHRVGRPQRWLGSLRRVSFARAVQASNSIEGYDASLDDVVAAVDGEPTLDANVETQLALAGYRDAMTYVLQLAQDPQASIDEGTMKALHFMMLKHDLSKSPGHWRPGAIFVRSEPSGEIVYEGPSPELVPELIGAMLEDLYDESVPVLIRAAIAHLNLVMIHPFRDGNGRMARCLQTLVLAREQIVAPVFSSIEEYLGRNTRAYYNVLAEVGQGGWHPRNDPRPWTRFCLTAHYRQAQTHLRRIEEAEALWAACAALTSTNGLPERCAGVLYDAAFGFRLRNATYRTLVERTMDEQVTPLTASRDLNALVRRDLLIPIGDGRGRYYLGSPSVRDLRDRIRASRPPRHIGDPFEIAA